MSKQQGAGQHLRQQKDEAQELNNKLKQQLESEKAKKHTVRGLPSRTLTVNYAAAPKTSLRWFAVPSRPCEQPAVLHTPFALWQTPPALAAFRLCANSPARPTPALLLRACPCFPDPLSARSFRRPRPPHQDAIVPLAAPDMAPVKIARRRTLAGHWTKVIVCTWGKTDSGEGRIASAGLDGQLIIWNADPTCDPVPKDVVIPLKCSWVQACAFNKGCTRVATGGLDDIISIFDVTDAKLQLGANNGDGEDDLTDYDPILQLPKPLSSADEGHDGYITGCHFLQSNGTAAFEVKNALF